MNIKILDKTDMAGIEFLLNYYNLVTQDIDFNNQLFLGLKTNRKYIGIGALEFHHPYALLRSVAINPLETGNGFANQICRALYDRALRERIIELYLLTETASEYFSKQGFEIVERLSVPKIIRSTNQFSTLCPDEATAMKKQLIPSI